MPVTMRRVGLASSRQRCCGSIATRWSQQALPACGSSCHSSSAALFAVSLRVAYDWVWTYPVAQLLSRIEQHPCCPRCWLPEALMSDLLPLTSIPAYSLILTHVPDVKVSPASDPATRSCLCAGSDEQMLLQSRSGGLRIPQSSAEPGPSSGCISWIGESALAIGPAAALCAESVVGVNALLYTGQSEQHFARVQRLLHTAASEPDLGSPRSQERPSIKSQSLWLPTKPAKLDKHGLERQLPSALQFIDLQRKMGCSILLCDDDGVDSCVCVALAAMLCRDPALVGYAASPGPYNMSAAVHCVKTAARARLAEISGSHACAGPTRTTLKQVYSYVARDWVAQQGRTACDGHRRTPNVADSEY